LGLSERIATLLQQTSHGTLGEKLDEETLDAAYKELAERFDGQHGGFSSAPKFPTSHNLLFLLRYWRRRGNQEALDMLERTLEAMQRGGIYDHVGFGFHRYSTDSQWLVPHFEKMLYDQAVSAMAYTEAYQATRTEDYEKTAREIFTYVLRDMTAPEGGFYSAEDADSEGVEGKFYVWTQEEIRRALGNEGLDFATEVFNIEEGGNFVEQATGRKSGVNILHVRRPLDQIASDLNLSRHDLQKGLESIRRRLFAEREERVHPTKDDKILTDWNGLMIAALAKGAQAFGVPEYAEAAQRAADLIIENMRKPDGRLVHRYWDGQAGIQANLDDYAFLVWGLIELYEAVFDTRYLKAALDLTNVMLSHFWDKDVGGFYLTPDDGETILVRKKEIHDGAIPSGNSVAMLNLLRLGRMTANPNLEEKADRTGSAFSGDVKRLPSAHTQLMVALDFGLGPSYEVVVAGSLRAGDTRAMLEALRTLFLPNKVVLLNAGEQESTEIAQLAPFIGDQPSIGGKATAYVCLNYSCSSPTTDVTTMLELLNSG
jgi:hypothetical protein